MTNEQSEKLDTVLSEVLIIKKLLYGNGDIGLCEEVRNLKKTRESFFKLPNTIDSWAKLLLTLGVVGYLLLKAVRGGLL